MSTKLPNASTTLDGIILNTAQTINGQKQANVPDGQSWVFDRAYTAAAVSNHAVLVQRNGGAVALAIGYNDTATNMYLGTSTNHSFDFRTNNTKAGAIGVTGSWTLGAGQSQALFHEVFSGFNVSGKLSSSGTYSLGSQASAADDTERLAYVIVNTFNTGGTARFQFMGNKNGSGVHGWGTNSAGGMVFGRGDAASGFINLTTYAVANTAGEWTFGSSSTSVHSFTGSYLRVAGSAGTVMASIEKTGDGTAGLIIANNAGAGGTDKWWRLGVYASAATQFSLATVQDNNGSSPTEYMNVTRAGQWTFNATGSATGQAPFLVNSLYIRHVYNPNTTYGGFATKNTGQYTPLSDSIATGTSGVFDSAIGSTLGLVALTVNIAGTTYIGLYKKSGSGGSVMTLIAGDTLPGTITLTVVNGNATNSGVRLSNTSGSTATVVFTFLNNF